MKHPHHPEFKEAQTTVEFLLGPIKIKDGLFMGDQLAARDIEFIITNKVTHVINTVSKIVPNLYERFGVQYLSVHWTEKEENIFDKKNNAINAIYSFVQEAMEQGESCLIHSVHGKSRSCAVLVAYLIKRYSWSLNKCLEFINSKKENLEIRNNFLSQLQDLQKRMMENQALTTKWSEVKTEEDLVLANTFANSKKMELKDNTSSKKNNKKKVTWDEKIAQRTPMGNMSATMTRFKQSQEKEVSGKPIKSILKGESNDDQNKFQEDLDQDFTGLKINDDRFISTINGNIVHVTVNNFITTDKKPDNLAKTYNSRPYSSDAKEREKKQEVKPNKLFPYESPNILGNIIKTPYDTKLINKIGSNNKITKKKEEIRNPVMMAYQRPQSAGISADKKKIKTPLTPQNVPLANGIMGRQEMMITGLSNKKRYPSTNPKDDPYKWK